MHLDGCKALSYALIRNLSIVSLDISRNALKSDAMRHLAEALSKNDSLETVNLNLNPLGPMVFLELSRAISKTESLKCLFLHGCKAMECDSYLGFFHFCSQLRLNRSIITLHLQNNNIGEYGAQERKEESLMNPYYSQQPEVKPNDCDNPCILTYHRNWHMLSKTKRRYKMSFLLTIQFLNR